jgi:hypothetical protein
MPTPAANTTVTAIEVLTAPRTALEPARRLSRLMQQRGTALIADRMRSLLPS